MSKSNVMVAFSLGAVVGAFVSWKMLERKYENLFKEEVSVYKERLVKRYSGPQQSDEPTYTDDERKADIQACDNISKQNGYLGSDEEEVIEASKPYVIAPEEFGDNDDYGTESLTLYSDGVLTDDMDNVIEDVDGLVGTDSLTHFGEYEDDSVFVRNDNFKCDYEILQDERTYAQYCETRTSRRES